eukprot:CAMPEP_0205945522 /NCGR_PEP_ID=MMETSP1325-20131115/66368_1 /ASSEMBLY_ACC=CAM_ASM_000708 /TAXON_ID=236786 /ORGANISM="Florenciella sp., Strain RCC1007" /LENGTH=33 /DNA_ID= /DNA_START= /DNA_END= /DNA_ORIENTATION=
MAQAGQRQRDEWNRDASEYVLTTTTRRKYPRSH